MDELIKKNVDHPAHYNHPGKKECIEEMRDQFGDVAVYWFCKLSAFKYRYRGGSKADNSEEQDAAKAVWYDDYSENLTGTVTPTDVDKALAPWND